MGTVTTALRREAESIFSDLGYAVTAQEGELRAERKWRVVEITPLAEPDEPPVGSSEFQCFVTWADNVPALERRLEHANPDCEWAIIGVQDDEKYVVSRRTT